MKATSLGVAATLLAFSFMFTNSATAMNTVDFSDSGGTLAGTTAGLTLSGSTLVTVIGFNSGGIVTGDLGSVSFSTGVLASGSLATGGTFQAGGRFTVAGNGTNGIPNDVLFFGTFSGPVSWTLTTLANGTHNYMLTGVLVGSMAGKVVNAATVQLTVNTGKGFFHNSTLLGGGDTTTVSSVPEPSTLSLLLTGTLGTLGIIRRKILARSN
ncbi:MAG TPA: PEP-CTERM sorting domain-containing protein [Candidatus Binatia bacterium]|nr:PEP-CTERM sorting domain-containing protein [Candidatus Binatia bacterium]